MPCQVSFVAVKRLYKRENWEMRNDRWILIANVEILSLFRLLIVTWFLRFFRLGKKRSASDFYLCKAITFYCFALCSLARLQSSFYCLFLTILNAHNDAQLQAQFIPESTFEFQCNWCYNLRIFLLLWSLFVFFLRASLVL